MVVAAPAQLMPRSASTHSRRVPDRIDTRSSRPTPSVTNPAAMALARSPTSPHVIQLMPVSSGVGTANARPLGVLATLLRIMSGIDR